MLAPGADLAGLAQRSYHSGAYIAVDDALYHWQRHPDAAAAEDVDVDAVADVDAVVVHDETDDLAYMHWRSPCYRSRSRAPHPDDRNPGCQEPLIARTGSTPNNTSWTVRGFLEPGKCNGRPMKRGLT